MTRIDLPTASDAEIKYFTDGNKIYWLTSDYEVKGADLSTFELYVGWFAKDKNHCYFEGAVFKKAETETFEVLSWAFAKDKNNVYTNRGILKDADPESFEIMGNGYELGPAGWVTPVGYGKDANNIFYYAYGTKTIKLKDVDIKTFVEINNFYGKDDNFVFYNGMKLKNANSKTWKLLDGYAYSIDDMNAYCGKELINGADVETFVLFSDKKYGGEYAKDKNYIYNHSIRIGVSREDWFFNENEIKEFMKKDDPKYYAKWYGK